MIMDIRMCFHLVEDTDDEIRPWRFGTALTDGRSLDQEMLCRTMLILKILELIKVSRVNNFEDIPLGNY